MDRQVSELYEGLQRNEELTRVLEAQFAAHVNLAYWDDYRALEADILRTCLPLAIRHGVVSLGDGNSLDSEASARVEQAIRRLLPWRKGPFSLCGVEIDAEWRSDLKWDRIRPALGDLRGKRIADVGCSNGYYMFRMLEHDPELVVGLDPNGRAYYQFQLIQRFVQSERLEFLPLGIEHLDPLASSFDLALCMGVLYHRRDPLSCLEKLRNSLRPGGQLVLETISLEGNSPYCLCPPGRYSKMRNVWFIPTDETLVTWIRRAGFVDVDLFSQHIVTSDEQRRTELAPFESLSDFLDPKDPTKTVEGYPAPRRVAVSAFKPC